MSGAWVEALAPLLILTVGATVLMLQIALKRDARAAQGSALVVLGLAAASALAALAGGVPEATVTPLLVADAPALLLALLFALAGAATVALSGDYLATHAEQQEEYYLLVLLAVLGATALAYAVHVASLVLGLELLSVSCYALIAYPADRRSPVEAAVKYVVLSGAATATLLFGFALLFAATGTLAFEELGAALRRGSASAPVAVAAATLVLAGLALKIAAAPFHLWTPDVYEGAPAPVSGFLASVVKAASLFVLLRLFVEADLFRYDAVIQGTVALALLSMLVGNWLALLQTNVKRLLGYSSIAHAGYLLIVFAAASAPAHRGLALEAAVFYLVAYVPTALAAFALLTQLSAAREGDDVVAMDDLAGLFWRQPLRAVLLFVALLSLAGIPLTAGFVAKFYLFAAAAAGDQWLLLAALVAGSALGIYYYLRLVYVMTLQPTAVAAEAGEGAPGRGPRAVSLALIALILFLGLLPGALMRYLSELFS